jgi:hypothetical protein
MRAVRFLTFAFLLVAGLVGTASAQAYNNTPGVYTDVRVGVVPALLPAGSLPGTVGNVGTDLYTGTLTVIRNGDGSYSVQYQGTRIDGDDAVKDARLNVSATFSSEWLGWRTQFLAVGSSMEEIISGIDAIHLVSANINGIGTVDGSLHRVIAKFLGTGSYPPDLAQFKVLKAPGYLR